MNTYTQNKQTKTHKRTKQQQKKIDNLHKVIPFKDLHPYEVVSHVRVYQSNL